MSAPNGNILLTGGTAQYDADINNCNGRWHGARFAYEFDVNTGTLVEQAPMNTGRWYPTLVTLPDGKVIVVSGLDDYESTTTSLKCMTQSLNLGA